MAEKFEDHYIPWREARVSVLAELYPLQGKKVLELGCGYGHVGRMLELHGAEVTSCDARAGYVKVAMDSGTKRGLVYNIEDPWPDELGDDWDLIVHWGVLYHTLDFEAALQCLTKAKTICLETEVCNSIDPEFSLNRCESNGYDQAASAHLHGRRASAGYVEKILNGPGRSVQRYDLEKLNTPPHDYSWEASDDAIWILGRRRFWMIQNGCPAI